MFLARFIRILGIVYLFKGYRYTVSHYRVQLQSLVYAMTTFFRFLDVLAERLDANGNKISEKTKRR